MKLRNKKTGEVGYLIVGKGCDRYVVANDEWHSCGEYNSLAELNEEWEDYEESKKYWFINAGGEISSIYEEDEDEEDTKSCEEIGNYFETKEEAEKAVEKLKALKRLKDKGFRFDGWSSGLGKNAIYTIFWSGNDGEFDLRKDLDLLFSKEDD